MNRGMRPIWNLVGSWENHLQDIYKPVKGVHWEARVQNEK
jgi:hypothetical protein